MRRKDREILDPAAMRDILDRCEVVRLGLHDPEDPLYPYIVPVNFGWDTAEDGTIRLYFHGARAGRKFDLLQTGTVCSFEMDCDAYLDLVPEHRDITTRYRSLMGKATVTRLEGDELLRGLSVLLDRRDDTRVFDWDRSLLPRLAVWQLDVTDMTAKANRAR